MAQAPAPAPSSTHARTNGLLLATAIVGFGFIASRLLGVLRTVVIAEAFGSNPELDAYNVAFRVPDLIFQVLAGATLGSAFIPVFARLYRRKGEERAWQLASTMLNLVTAGTAALCIAAFVLAPVLVPQLAPGLGDDIGRRDELVDEAVSLTRLMLLSPFLFAISGMVTGILNGRQKFLLSALAPVLYNLAIIFGAVVLSRPFGVEGLAAGVVVGAALHLAIQIPGLIRERMRYRPSFSCADPAVIEVGRLMGPRVAGLAAAQVNFLVTIYFASKVGASAISNLNYAWLLAQLPLAIFAMAISTALFPRLAERIADGDVGGMAEDVARALRVIMFLTVPAAVGLAMLGVPVVTTLLERGEFTRAETAVTAGAMAWYCLGIVPQAGIEIHSRAFYAMGDTLTPVVLAVAAVALNLALSAILWGRFGIEGLAFSVSAAAWLEWSVLYWWLSLRTGRSPLPELHALALVSVCAAAMALFLALGFGFAERDGRFDNIVVAIAGAAAGVLVYTGAARLARIEELHEAFSRLPARFRRSQQSPETAGDAESIGG